MTKGRAEVTSSKGEQQGCLSALLSVLPESLKQQLIGFLEKGSGGKEAKVTFKDLDQNEEMNSLVDLIFSSIEEGKYKNKDGSFNPHKLETKILTLFDSFKSKHVFFRQILTFLKTKVSKNEFLDIQIAEGKKYSAKPNIIFDLQKIGIPNTTYNNTVLCIPRVIYGFPSASEIGFKFVSGEKLINWQPFLNLQKDERGTNFLLSGGIALFPSEKQSTEVLNKFSELVQLYIEALYDLSNNFSIVLKNSGEEYKYNFFALLFALNNEMKTIQPTVDLERFFRLKGFDIKNDQLSELLLKVSHNSSIIKHKDEKLQINNSAYIETPIHLLETYEKELRKRLDHYIKEMTTIITDLVETILKDYKTTGSELKKEQLKVVLKTTYLT